MIFFQHPEELRILFSFLFFGALIALVFVSVFQLVLSRSAFTGRSGRSARFSRLLVSMLFLMSYLGLAVGILGGWSRIGVVGDVITAVLGFFGGLTVYLFDRNKARTFAIIPSVLAFTVSVFVGYQLGAEVRNPIERSLAYRDMCMAAFSNSDVLTTEDAYCRFLNGAGAWCWSALFDNQMAYSADGALQGEKYQIERDKYLDERLTHMNIECAVRVKERDTKLFNFLKSQF